MKHRTPRHLRWRAALLLLFLALLVACGKQPERIALPGGQEAAWEPRFVGVDALAFQVDAPKPNRFQVVRINLQAPGISFLVTPPHEPHTGLVLSQNTSTFLQTHRCQVAINGSPFGPVVQEEGQPQQVVGLSISKGVIYSPSDDGYDALLITRDNRARIVHPPYDTRDVWNGLGGFALLLKDGKVQPQSNEAVHPRTAVGLSHDRRYLYLVVVDGRQPNYSEGLTLAQTAQWMKDLGCHDALNLDGGGSSTLVIADKLGAPVVQNCPIDRHIPGTQRPVANHLGVFAQPLP